MAETHEITNRQTHEMKKSFFQLNEVLFTIMGIALVIVVTIMYLMADRYALALERTSSLEKENAELHLMLVTQVLASDAPDEVKDRLDAYSQMLLKKYQ